MKKKMIAILSRYLWPVDGGRKESLNHYLKELYDNYGYDIYLMCFMEYGQKINARDFPYYIKNVIELKEVPTLEKIRNLFEKSFGKSKWPFQCSLYYSKENLETIKKMVEYLKPDVIFTEMIRTCTYFDAFKDSEALMLANLDDLLSVRYLRQSEMSECKANMAGSYSNKLPPLIAKFINTSVFKRIVLRLEAERCQKWEKEIYKLYDFSLMTSDRESKILNDKMEGEKAKTLSVGIDYNYYSEKLNLKRDEKGLSFLGNFDVAANQDTLDMIIKDVLPYIQSDYNFYIIGKCPYWITDKYKVNTKLHFCGRVDDVRMYIKKTSIFLAPISYGTGVKTKIVEAMAMNMPVITNSVGAEGIYAQTGRDYIVYDDPQKIAQSVDLLLNNPSLAHEIGENAGKFVYAKFRWDKVLAVYKEIGV